MSSSKNGLSSGATGGGGGGPGSSKNKPVESLTEIFRCFICMEKLRGAHMCSHCSKLCCYNCIQRWLETSNHCPHCRSSLLPHEVIKCRWAEEVTTQLDSLIHAASSSSANVPGLLMPDKAPRSGSSLLDAMLMSQAADQDKERCSTHNREQLSVYCTTCKCCICHECALWSTSHHGHTFKPIDEIYNFQCQLIKEHVLKLRRRFMELIGCVQEIEKNIEYATTTKDVQVREIRNSVEQMIGRLDSYLKTKLMTLVNQKGHLNRKSEELDNLLQDIESQLSTCPKSELISIGTKLVTVIDDTLQRCTYTMTPVTIDFQSEIIPKYDTCNVFVNNFSALREKGEPFYSEPLQVYGHCWRLKIYPNGNGVVRGSYLSLFLELTAGPSEIAKYEYRIEMIYQNGFDATKNMMREFSSDFEVGECWGYNRFFRLDLLDSEGFRIPEVDVLQFRFDVRPTTYYQKCKDMDWHIQQLKTTHRNNGGVNGTTPVPAVEGAAAGPPPTATIAGPAVESSVAPLLNELSSRMGKLVVKNSKPKSYASAVQDPAETSRAAPTVALERPGSAPGGSEAATSAIPTTSSNISPGASGTENGQPRRQTSTSLPKSSPTSSLFSISSYLANNSSKDKEKRNSMTEGETMSPFYEEYLQLCGADNNSTASLPDNYFLSGNDANDGDASADEEE